ncbi:MAG: class I SAM-dependent rRNA methyltransferase [Aliifodinibius sp.]|nr:class I SAM-dependent rRNA methyltransferase [Fodinibius sp.]
MNLINQSPPVKVQLARNLVKVIKRGHAWVYADALRSIPSIEPGTPAILLDNRGGKEIARGFLDPTSPIALRICTTQPGHHPSPAWAETTMQRALALRKSLFSPFQHTNAFRLFNGEGDGLPGLVCDIYDHAAVIVTDGAGPEKFWRVEQIAAWLGDQLAVTDVYHKYRQETESNTVQILASSRDPVVYFQENGFTFMANPISGQKTGFFLDQRDNRKAIMPWAKEKKVLNVFGYTGGFSVYAGKSGATQVTTIDTAQPALKDAEQNWQYNHLPPEKHETICEDAFEALSGAKQQKQTWDLVILDPPSFASSESSLPQAVKAYTRLFTLGAQVTEKGGVLAAASCSSHLRRDQFLKIVEESVSAARRRATLLGFHGQPPDHPAPLAMPELRYLKFILLKLN